MTKTSRNLALAAEESFHKHFSAIWGEERWRDSLYPALAQQTSYAALYNQYAPSEDFWRCLKDAQILPDDLEELEFPRTGGVLPGPTRHMKCYAQRPRAAHDDGVSARAVSELPFPQPTTTTKHSDQLLTHWNMDAASILVAYLLDVCPTDNVLDLCAAPGGKSIALSQRMWPSSHADNQPTPSPPSTENPARLVSNEEDGRRQRRLADNLQSYLPPRLFKQGNARTTRVDATQTGPGLNTLVVSGGYNKVLVDAPCSSERHIIHAHLRAQSTGNAAPEMSNWRPNSSKRLAKSQLELLMTGLKLTKVGGRLTYATCSISTAENDGVVEKLLSTLEKEKKKGSKWSVRLGFSEGTAATEQLEAELQRWAERTKYGWIVLPDHQSGGRWGPLFFALLEKTAVDAT